MLFSIETNKFANQQDAQKAIERLTSLYDDNGNQLINSIKKITPLYIEKIYTKIEKW